MLHLTGGDSIAGILLSEYDDCLTLARARLLNDRGGRLVPLDGEVVVPYARIRFAQAGVSIDDTASGRNLEVAAAEGSRA